MKNIELSSRDTDRKLLMALSSSGFAAFVGFVLPTPFDAPGIRLLDALISLGLGGLAWGVFHLLEPERYGRKWDIVRTAGVPVLWLLVVLALGVWFYFLHARLIEEHERQAPRIILTASANKLLQATRDGRFISASVINPGGPEPGRSATEA